MNRGVKEEVRWEHTGGMKKAAKQRAFGDEGDGGNTPGRLPASRAMQRAKERERSE